MELTLLLFCNIDEIACEKIETVCNTAFGAGGIVLQLLTKQMSKQM
jgi:hypothetical protein